MVNYFKKKIISLRQSYLGRKLEHTIRFPKQKFITLGDNNSSFFRPGWETANLFDADYIIDFRQDNLPFENNTLDAVHCSHVIEHISNEAGLKLIQEIYRCLKPGCYFRLSTPDMDLLLDKYRKGDWTFFLRANGKSLLNKIIQGDLVPESLLMHNCLVAWFASYSGRLDTGGGPIVNQQLVESKLATLSKYEFRDWCVSLLEKGRTFSHIHLYDYEELYFLLKKAGFKEIYRSYYGKSVCPAMSHPPVDIPKHKLYSLYVEVIKS